MKNNDLTQIHNEMISSPVVRIDALDENFIQPLREFFAMNGCQVFINSSPSPFCTYHLVVGDLKFVKSILDGALISSQKTMCVIWDIKEESVTITHVPHIKIALIDPKAISGELLGLLCNFFFTGNQKIKNFQTAAPKKIVEERPKQREEKEVKHSNEKEDAKRIAQTISQEFISPKIHTPKRQNKNWLFIALTLFCISFIIPLCLYIGSLTILSVSLYQQMLCLKTSGICRFQMSSQLKNQFLHTAHGSFSVLQIPLKLIHQSRTITKQENLMNTLEKMTTILASGAEVNTVATNFITSFLTMDLSKQDNISTVVQVEQLKTQLFSLQTNIDLSYRMLQQMAKDPPFPVSLPFFETRLKQGITTIARIRRNMQTAERLLLLYPYVSGYKQPLTLLVLLQNNNELRPTGGFIGSLMHLTIEDGAISDMRVEDVYTVDGQLKGHVDPPIPIRDVLTQEHWYLRDSNWNPDFEESAQKAMWFYQKETGESVNGVIAMNASFIMKLLRLTGPVRLIDGGDEIREDNFFTKSLEYTQTDFFPGSTQKKDFLGNLLQTLTTTIFQSKKISGVQLFETIDQALQEREAQLFFTDSDAEQLVTQFEWAGKLPTKQVCDSSTTPQCVLHYLGAIEANLGVNKVNYYIRRNDTRDIAINETGKVTETFTRVMRNSTTDAPGSGIYRNYMRFYIPKFTHITAFTINGISVPTKSTDKKTALALPYGEFDTTANAWMTSIAGVFDIPTQQEATISLSYEYEIPSVVTDRDISFMIYTQKQSGIETVPTLIRVRYPSVWKAQENDQTSVVTLANNGYLEYNSTMLQDSNIQIHFIKE